MSFHRQLRCGNGLRERRFTLQREKIRYVPGVKKIHYTGQTCLIEHKVAAVLGKRIVVFWGVGF